MPSWNIHIAQTERLLERGGAVARTVRDANAFLFGSLVPDIMVGYMVPGITDPIPYRQTHFAAPAFIPKPREREFWDTYVAPQFAQLTDADFGCAHVLPTSIEQEREAIDRIHFPQRFEGEAAADPALASASDAAHEPSDQRTLFDFLLGTWAHLLADNLWNTRVNQFLDEHGGKPSEQFRIKKQGDFDGFGKMLPISSIPRETPALVHAAQAFPQYAIARPHVHDAIVVTHEIVRTNGAPDHAPYQLLTDDFFEITFAEVLDTTEQALKERLQLPL